MNKIQIEEAVRKRVAESPDNVYTQANNCCECSYTVGNCTDGTVGCLFGQILPKEIIDQVESVSEDEEGVYVDTECITDVLESCMDIKDPDFVGWCSRIQAKQDTGLKWNDALSFADNLRKELEENAKNQSWN